MRKIQFLIIAVLFGYSFSAMAQAITGTLSKTNFSGSCPTGNITTLTATGNYYIPSMAFTNCTALQSITLPEGLTDIGSSAFAFCSGLSSITLPEGLTDISSGAFTNCSSLSSITLPATLTSLGDDVFLNCTGLTKVTFLGTNPSAITFNLNIFNNCSALTSIYVPKGTVATYKTALTNAGYGSLVNLVSEPPTYTITLNLSLNGSATVNGTNYTAPRTFSEGEDITIIFTPASDYEIGNISISGGGGLLTGGNTYTISGISDNYTIGVTFTPPKPKPILRIGGKMKVGKGTKVIIGPP